MVKVDLRGVAKVTAKGRTYWYAWRGGPRLRGEPGSPEFVASYNEAIEEWRTPDQLRFRALVTLYRASAEYKSLAPSTQKNWSIWLDRVGEYFGDLRIAQFDRPEKIRPVIRQWRNKWADKPRTADYALQVLSRVLAHAVDPLGKIAGNPCEGVKRLYSGDRSDIIWTQADIAEFKAVSSRELADAVDLASHTGLRLGDLIRVSWSHVGGDAKDLHFHDLRGTAATKFYVAGLSVRVIAEIMGWEEETVEKIIRRYVGRGAATRAAIAQLNETRRRT